MNIENENYLKNEILAEVKKYISDSFNSKSPANNLYHSYEHTVDVVLNVMEIGMAYELHKADLEMLQIAAWFHDIGHFDAWENHEEKSAMSARKFLEVNKYPEDKIDKVCKCITATKLIHRPQNLLEEIIKDADLNYLGSIHFFEQSDQLKTEIENREGRTIPVVDWLKINIEFLSIHTFFTEYVKEKFSEMKNNNITELKQLYSKEIRKNKR